MSREADFPQEMPVTLRVPHTNFSKQFDCLPFVLALDIDELRRLDDHDGENLYLTPLWLIQEARDAFCEVRNPGKEQRSNAQFDWCLEVVGPVCNHFDVEDPSQISKSQLDQARTEYEAGLSNSPCR